MTVAVYVPPAEAVQDKVEVPEIPTLVGLRVQLSPLEGVTEILTVPWNPVVLDMLMAEVEAEPTGAERAAGLGEIEKSGVVVVTNVDRA